MAYNVMKLMIDSQSKALDKHQKYISFTFDDAPESALMSAADILYEHHIRGTYYIAMGLMHEGCFSASELTKCVAQLHHIECHTYHHVNLTNNFSEELLVRETQQNLTAIQEIFPGVKVLDNFAYPFGALNQQVKKSVRKYFSSARGITSGINQGEIDLHELRAVQLYEHRAPLSAIEKYIESLQSEGGWLIFYTHDVQTAFSKYGCSAEYFRKVVELANQADITCLPVADVLADFRREK